MKIRGMSLRLPNGLQEDEGVDDNVGGEKGSESPLFRRGRKEKKARNSST